MTTPEEARALLQDLGMFFLNHDFVIVGRVRHRYLRNMPDINSGFIRVQFPLRFCVGDADPWQALPGGPPSLNVVSGTPNTLDTPPVLCQGWLDAATGIFGNRVFLELP